MKIKTLVLGLIANTSIMFSAYCVLSAVLPEQVNTEIFKVIAAFCFLHLLVEWK